MPKPRRTKKKTFIVPVEYTVRGTVVVEAENAIVAASNSAILQVLECPPTCESPDWEATGPARLEDAED